MLAEARGGAAVCAMRTEDICLSRSRISAIDASCRACCSRSRRSIIERVSLYSSCWCSSGSTVTSRSSTASRALASFTVGW